MAKIPERIIFDVIYDDLIARNWLISNQHGFRRSEGAEEAIISSIKTWKEIITNGLDAKGTPISGINVIFFDFSKAFDRTWNQGILYN